MLHALWVLLLAVWFCWVQLSAGLPDETLPGQEQEGLQQSQKRVVNPGVPVVGGMHAALASGPEGFPLEPEPPEPPELPDAPELPEVEPAASTFPALASRDPAPLSSCGALASAAPLDPCADPVAADVPLFDDPLEDPPLEEPPRPEVDPVADPLDEGDVPLEPLVPASSDASGPGELQATMAATVAAEAKTTRRAIVRVREVGVFTWKSSRGTGHRRLSKK